MKEIISKNIIDLSKEELKELNGYIEQYVTIKAYLENFIACKELDEDEITELIDNEYEESMSRYDG